MIHGFPWEPIYGVGERLLFVSEKLQTCEPNVLKRPIFCLSLGVVCILVGRVQPQIVTTPILPHMGQGAMQVGRGGVHSLIVAHFFSVQLKVDRMMFFLWPSPSQIQDSVGL